ncbi:MAG: P-II family nitrogen regulator [Spirochaetes bacterium]|nr:P-II family nitrogen regulator [Spirochaetota bacterium]
MKEIIAMIRMNMINKTKRALSDAGINSITVREALGRGKGMIDMSVLKGAEKGYEEAISQLGQSQRLIPKRAVIIAVTDDLVQTVVDTIISVNQTGKSGDGKIFVMPILDVVRIRTGESGDNVLDKVF